MRICVVSSVMTSVVMVVLLTMAGSGLISAAVEATVPPKHLHHHVFFLRHCVRSTNDHVKLYNSTTTTNASSANEKHYKRYNLHDFIPNQSLPKWGVPEMSCTNVGLEIVQGIGRSVFQKIVNRLRDDDEDGGGGGDVSSSNCTTTTRKRKVLRLNIQLITDVKQRDIDTTYALHQGILQGQTAWNNDDSHPVVEITQNGGANFSEPQITYSRALFDPWDDGLRPPTTTSASPENANKDDEEDEQHHFRRRKTLFHESWVSSSSSTNSMIVNTDQNSINRRKKVIPPEENMICQNKLTMRSSNDDDDVQRRKEEAAAFRTLIKMQIQKRLDTIRPPNIPTTANENSTGKDAASSTENLKSSLNDAWKRIMEVATSDSTIGTDDNNDDALLPPSLLDTEVVIVDDDTELSGIINAIHWIAQTVFFSRASGIGITTQGGEGSEDVGGFDDNYVDKGKDVAKNGELPIALMATSNSSSHAPSSQSASSSSSASNPFLTSNVTLTDMYNWIQLSYWYLSIIRVENSLAASKGTVMAYTILQALQHGSVNIYPGSHNVTDTTSYDATRSSEGNDDNDDDCIEYHYAKVTIFVGHDANLNSLATAFGVRWKLGPPYLYAKNDTNETTNDDRHYDHQYEYAPTPPGSGMHFMYNADSGDVEMSYVCPNYVTEMRSIYDDELEDDQIVTNQNDMVLNTSGILEETPLRLISRNVSENGDVHSISVKSDFNDVERAVLKFNGLDILNDQLLSTIRLYPDSAECYDGVKERLGTIMADNTNLDVGSGSEGGDDENVIIVTAATTIPSSTTETTTTTYLASHHLLIVLNLLLFVIGIGIGISRCYCLRRQNTQRYDAVKINNDDDEENGAIASATPA